MKLILTLLKYVVILIIGALLGTFLFLSAFPLSDVKARQIAFEPENHVHNLQTMSEVFPTRMVPRGGVYEPLPQRSGALDGFTFTHDGAIKKIGDLFSDMETTGLMIIQDGEVLYENYAMGAGPATRFASWSAVKSITTTLVGFAVGDGLINSVEDPLTDYLPDLEGTAYEGVTIREAMEMSSGVRFDPKGPEQMDDSFKLVQDGPILGKVRAYDRAKSFPREADPGTKFNYNTAESQVLLELVRKVTGKNAADYLSEKVWQPLGMKHDAVWIIDNPGKEGAELGGMMFNATLEDYARFGMLIEQNGNWQGQQLLPRDWVRRATARELPHLAAETVYPSAGRGYGWHWWVLKNDTFTASGAYGQAIFINQAHNLVIARTSAWEDSWNEAHNFYWTSFYDALADKLATIE